MSGFLYQSFVEPLSQGFFLKALLGGIITAVVCSVIGCLVILKRMSFLGDALSHAMIAGVSGGYLFMKIAFGVEAYAPAMLAGSVIAAVITIGLIGFVSNISRVKEDTAIGIVYTGVFAAGVVLVSIFHDLIHIDIVHFIMGDVLGIADSDLWVSAFVAAVVLSVIILFFRYFQITAFDPVMAASMGIPVVLLDYALTTGVSLVVVSAVTMVGVILVVGLLITPAATAYLLSDRLDRMMMLAALFGVTSVVGGLYLSVWLDSSGGGAIMLFCAFQFLFVLFIAPRYGIISNWLRKRRMIPQELREDLLVSILRKKGYAIEISELKKYVRVYTALIPRAVKTLLREQLIRGEKKGWVLTHRGEEEAMKTLRAHRLWESYLQSVGTPSGEIHQMAHHLEHLEYDQSAGYLDLKLGHPHYGPHGEYIPEESDIIGAIEAIPLKELKMDEKAEIISVGEQAGKSGLKKGDIILRETSANKKIKISRNKKEKTLDEDTASQIFVKLIKRGK
jgi:ABC-type Mn2+/Zn2+ transport system permease subunit/Mn-dependent DtxR family transcriptional regulator